jgi:hypothetical protein
MLRTSPLPVRVSLILMVTLALTLSSASSAIEIDPELEEQMQAEGTAGYVMSFHSASNLTEAPKTDWKAQSEFLDKAVQDSANKSQAPVRSYLFNRRIGYRTFWKTNTIVVEKSDRDTLEGLKAFPEIESIKLLRTGAGTSPNK